MVLQAEFEAAVNSGAKDSARVVDEVLAYPGADSDLLEGFVTVCQVGGQTVSDKYAFPEGSGISAWRDVGYANWE